jgi:hypothetical protein
VWIGIVFMPIRIRIRPNFHFDADPNPDPDWHQNDADPHADRTPSFTYVGKSEKFTFSHNIASLQWLSFSSVSKMSSFSVFWTAF